MTTITTNTERLLDMFEQMEDDRVLTHSGYESLCEHLVRVHHPVLIRRATLVDDAGTVISWILRELAMGSDDQDEVTGTITVRPTPDLISARARHGYSVTLTQSHDDEHRPPAPTGIRAAVRRTYSVTATIDLDAPGLTQPATSNVALPVLSTTADTREALTPLIQVLESVLDALYSAVHEVQS